MYPGLLFDALPWWIAAPLLQLGLLVFGMALDETYVNRTTILTGALALWVHSVVAGDVWLPVALYLDAGIVIGAYGLYAYVLDAYVANWFRVLAYFVYSPLSIFLVIILPDVVFPLALALAGYGNLQLMDYFYPTDPYYFGPDHPDEYEEAVAETAADTGPDAAAATAGPGSVAAETVDGTATDTVDGRSAETVDGRRRSEPDRPRPDPTPAGGDSSERGILPEFMRRL